MRMFLLVTALVTVTAQYKHVDFTIYGDEKCGGDGELHQAAIGECHKAQGDDYVMLGCTNDGKQVILQVYSDDSCKTSKDKHSIDTGKCMVPPNATGHSLKVGCNKAFQEKKIDHGFERWMEDHEKTYGDVLEYHYRLHVFLKNLEKISLLNKQQPEAQFGIGPFTDLTAEEFEKYYTCGGEWEAEPLQPLNRSQIDDVDWRSKGAVTSVKDQGRCGSCWAFSATACIEGEAFISQKYKLQDLAVQEIVSCDKKSSGCNGGDPATGYTYVKNAGGIELQSDYPYTSGGGSAGSCKFDKSKIAVVISGYSSVSGGESGLGKALAGRPISICHQTGGWQHYSGGIMTSCSSGGGHCTLAVGYASSGDYWIIKNSWAERWGNAGYLYLKQGSNLCGITNHMTRVNI